VHTQAAGHRQTGGDSKINVVDPDSHLTAPSASQIIFFRVFGRASHSDHTVPLCLSSLLRVTGSRQIQHHHLCVCVCVHVCVGVRMKSISAFPAARAVSLSCQRRGGNYGTCCVEGKPGHQGGIRTVNLLSLLPLPPPSSFNLGTTKLIPLHLGLIISTLTLQLTKNTRPGGSIVGCLSL